MKAKTPARKVGRKAATKTATKATAAKPSSARTKPSATPAARTAAPKPRSRAGSKTAAAQAPASKRSTPRPVAVSKRPVPARATGERVARKSAPATPSRAKQSPVQAAGKPRTARRRVARAPKLKIPAILLAGDRPPAPLVSGPGERYVLGPMPPVEKSAAAEAQLPEAYGTKRLFLTARDPQWLYAHWDLTREQQRLYNQRSADGHLVLRVHVERVGDPPLVEMHVHPESRHWFVHVGRGGTQYVAELGYYRRRDRVWTRVALSEVARTPNEISTEEAAAEFATIPPELPLPKLVALVRQAAVAHPPLARAIEELRAAGHPALPRITERPSVSWTPGQERALAEIVNLDVVRRVWIGSLEITELVRQQYLRQLASLAGAAFGWPTSPGGAITSVSSPFGGEQPGARGFWFNINAELIVYGATEPDATVTIGGRPIKLRPDGSFSYRFALPDGCYDLPAVAVSADKTDGRAAELRFTRQTAYRGDVGAHPQDPALKPPTPENV